MLSEKLLMQGAMHQGTEQLFLVFAIVVYATQNMQEKNLMDKILHANDLVFKSEKKFSTRKRCLKARS